MAALDTAKRSKKSGGSASRKPASLELLSEPEAPVAAGEGGTDGATEQAADSAADMTAHAAAEAPQAEPERAAQKKTKAKQAVKEKKAGTKKAEAKKEDRKNGRKEKEHIKYKSHVSRDDAAHYFEQIVAGLGQGVIRFDTGEAELVASPASRCEVEVKARRKGKKERVHFEISWHTDADAG